MQTGYQKLERMIDKMPNTLISFTSEFLSSIDLETLIRTSRLFSKILQVKMDWLGRKKKSLYFFKVVIKLMTSFYRDRRESATRYKEGELESRHLELMNALKCIDPQHRRALFRCSYTVGYFKHFIITHLIEFARRCNSLYLAEIEEAIEEGGDISEHFWGHHVHDLQTKMIDYDIDFVFPLPETKIYLNF